jgi:FG-GAP-like repeat
MIVSTTKLAVSLQHHRNCLCAIVALLGVAGGQCGAVPDSWAADPVARDLVAQAGLSWAGGTQGESAVLDFDRDGDFDLAPSRHGSAAWPIMRNNGNGTFTEVFSGTLVRTDRHGCIAADFGSTTGGAPDGRPDIYCVVGPCCSHKNDLVFKLPSGGFSANVSSGRGVADIHGRGRDAVAADFNADGRMDIAVANWSPSLDPAHPSPNRLFMNTASGVFRNVTGSPFDAEKASECVAAGDLTGDGRPELVFCEGNSGTAEGTLTYRNINGTFVDATAASSYRRQSSRDIEIVDFNGDGRKDLLILQSANVKIWLNAPGGLPSSPSYVRAILGGRDVAIGDVNLDRKPDIYVCTGGRASDGNQYPDLMLLNDGTGRGFRSIPIPQVTAGDGDNATPIPNWRGSGRAALLVTNSKSGSVLGSGPTQLIVFSGS